MNILVSGPGGVRTDFVQQYLIRMLNPDVQQSWNIDSYTGRTIQNKKPGNYPGKYQVYKEHSGIKRISQSQWVLSRRESMLDDYDKAIYILHNHTDIEECVKRSWEHIVKSFMFNSAEKLTVQEMYDKIEYESEVSLHGNHDVTISGASIVTLADMLDKDGWQTLQNAVGINFPNHAKHLWQVALSHSHSPKEVYYQGELFTKDHVRNRVNYYHAKRQEYYQSKN